MALRAVCGTKEEYDALFKVESRGGREVRGLLAVNPPIDGDEVEIAGETYVYNQGILTLKPKEVSDQPDGPEGQGE